MRYVRVNPDFDSTSLSQYLEKRVDPFILEWDRSGCFPEEVFRDFHDLGIAAAGLGAQFGGGGLPMIDLLAIASVLAFHSPGICSSWFGNLLGQTTLSRFASEELARQVLSSHLASRTMMSFCATERESGIDLSRMATSAIPVGGGFRLSGRKYYITNINHAAHLVVFAKVRASSIDPKRDLSVFYVPASSEGVRVGSPLQKLGQCESNTGSVEFHDVFVPSGHQLGKIGQGFEILSACISRTKTLISGAGVGIARRAESEALDYLARTERYGEPLLAKREIQLVLSQLRTRIDASWLLACRAGAVWDEKGTAVYESSMAKSYAADSAVQVVSEALELTGASGYMRENILGKLYRDVKLLEIYEGATLVQQAQLGRELYAPMLRKALVVGRKAA